MAKRKQKMPYQPPKLEGFSGIDWVDGAIVAGPGQCTTGSGNRLSGPCVYGMSAAPAKCINGQSAGGGCECGNSGLLTPG